MYLETRKQVVHSQEGKQMAITLNEMIIAALTTNSRKRKCAYQDELEALGYKIIKDGSWFIRNTFTDRYVELDYDGSYIRTTNKNIGFGRVWSSKKRNYVYKPITVINFEGLLNTNREIKRGYYHWNTVDQMRENLRLRKNHKTYLNNAMSEYQKKINTLTDEYQRKLEQAKRDYTYSIKWHTDGLKTANENIDKLLHHKTA